MNARQTIVHSTATFIETMRGVARMIARDLGSVTTDDLHKWADTRGIKPAHFSAWGAIFRGSEFLSCGEVVSNISHGHGNRIKLWRLRGAPQNESRATIMVNDHDLFGPFQPNVYRNRDLLELSRNRKCVRCGKYREGETVPARYHGNYAHLFGRGGGQKADDFMVADLCNDCHALFDSKCMEKGDWNDENEKEMEFLLCIARTWRTRLHDGSLRLVIDKSKGAMTCSKLIRSQRKGKSSSR